MGMLRSPCVCGARIAPVPGVGGHLQSITVGFYPGGGQLVDDWWVLVDDWWLKALLRMDLVDLVDD
jgi:hypothetical protein